MGNHGDVFGRARSLCCLVTPLDFPGWSRTQSVAEDCSVAHCGQYGNGPAAYKLLIEKNQSQFTLSLTHDVQNNTTGTLQFMFGFKIESVNY